jgi:putative endonuclease
MTTVKLPAAVQITKPVKSWCLYLIECRNGSYYAGITNRLDIRYAAHVAGRGARYTRANPPLRLLGFRNYPNRSSASRAEWQIKQLPKERKLAFLEDASSESGKASL